MKTTIAAIAVLALGGCASAAHLQDKPPAYVLASQKTAGQLEECISLKLSRLGTPSPIHGDGRTILVFGQPNPAFTVTIVDGSSGRTVEGRSGIGSAKSLRRDLETCI